MCCASPASAEIRKDGMSTRGRHGTQQVTAAYSAEASLGALDPIIEAIMRGTWDASVLAKTQADFTGLTTDVDGFNLQAGNPIAMGFRVGDVIRATGLPDAANVNRNLRVAALSTTKIFTAEPLTANAVAALYRRAADRECGRGYDMLADQAGQAADQSGDAAQIVFHG
jgi:hypothetical protein